MFAYLDKYGILHAVETEATTKQYATSKVIKTSIPCGGGYPLVPGTKEDHIIVYTKEKEFKINGATQPLDKLGEKYPEVAALVAQF